jgi:hypothetical protein
MEAGKYRCRETVERRETDSMVSFNLVTLVTSNSYQEETSKGVQVRHK